MGLFAPLVKKAQGSNRIPTAELSDKLFTPANGLTAARPLMAIKIANMLIKGQKGVTPMMMVMAATDGEGNVARFIDKHWPNSGLGSSSVGADADPLADTAAMLIVAGAALRAPRVSLTGKAAVGIILGQEGVKSVWALNSARIYAAATVSEEHPHGERLHIPVNDEGKEATIEKLVALTFATATNDFENPFVRQSLGLTALGLASVGSLRGELIRSEYEEEFNNRLVDLTAQPGLVEFGIK